MKVIIAGGRDFNNYKLLKTKLEYFLQNQKNIEIVSGGARGADSLGEKFAENINLKTTIFPADWDSYGKKAGFIRNRQMAEYADALVAFWDKKSRGTQSMIKLAKEYKLKIRIVNY